MHARTHARSSSSSSSSSSFGGLPKAQRKGTAQGGGVEGRQGLLPHQQPARSAGAASAPICRQSTTTKAEAQACSPTLNM